MIIKHNNEKYIKLEEYEKLRDHAIKQRVKIKVLEEFKRVFSKEWEMFKSLAKVVK